MEHDLRAHRLRTPLLVLIALLAAAGLILHGPIVQWASYHAFADARAWHAMPNALNVLSNLPFAVVGLWGAWHLRHEQGAWRAFAWSLTATAIGSAIYHWHPTDATLLIDRLPIACACALLVCAFFAERLHACWNTPLATMAALCVAAVAVACGAWGDTLGAGDLRPYLMVQLAPMLLIPAALLMRLPLRAPGVPANAWWWALALYAAAKGLEVGDASVMETLGLVSGHTLKHLLAAGAAALLVHARINSGSRR